jgi:hypothetical protein
MYQDSPRAVCGLAKLPVELQDVIYAHLPEEEFTLTVGVCDLASIKSWINTVSSFLRHVYSAFPTSKLTFSRFRHDRSQQRLLPEANSAERR